MRYLSSSKQIVFCLLHFLLVGCLSDESLAPAAELPVADGAENSGLHAVMSEQLAVDAARLNALLFDLHRTETELARERHEQYQRISATARSLQDGAALVRSSADSLSLGNEALARFRELAGQLEAQAEGLAGGALTGDLSPQQMDVVLSRINTTCDACHALYRNPAGARQ